jgi:hypothetical protein
VDLLLQVINHNPSFKSWIVSKHKNLPVSHSPSAVLEISSHIERVLASFPEEFDEKKNEVSCMAALSTLVYN